MDLHGDGAGRGCEGNHPALATERQGLLPHLSAGTLTNFKRHAAMAKDSGAEGRDAVSLVDDQRS